MSAKVYFQLLGTRGSRPIFDETYARFGGNTTAYKVWADGMFPLYIDGGTGLYREGKRLVDQVHDFTFLLTHSHWDHILAFPFFEPFYRPDTDVRFWGSSSFKETFEELFEHQFQTDAFPVPYAKLPAHIVFHDIMRKSQPFLIPPPSSHTAAATPTSADNPTPAPPAPGYTISRYQLNHPGLDFGYRIEYGGKAVVILTDTAPIENNHLGHEMQHFTRDDEKRYYQGLIEFSQQADLLLYDTHFNEKTIQNRRSWGHSTEVMAARLAMECGAKQLILGHHAPEDNDQAVLRKLANARQVCASHDLHVSVPEEEEIITL